MADIIRINDHDKSFDKTLEDMRDKWPLTWARMASNVVANVAAQGRKKEQQTAHELVMGEVQTKSKNAKSVTKRFSKWDSNVGWVSTSRPAGNGKSGYRMASFSWERTKKQRQTSAFYTSQLANLWSHRTNKYSEDSPYVGRPNEFRYLKRWKAGDSRPQKYNWTSVRNILAGEVDSSIRRTEQKFSRELKEL